MVLRLLTNDVAAEFRSRLVPLHYCSYHHVFVRCDCHEQQHCSSCCNCCYCLSCVRVLLSATLLSSQYIIITWSSQLAVAAAAIIGMQSSAVHGRAVARNSTYCEAPPLRSNATTSVWRLLIASLRGVLPLLQASSEWHA